MTIATLAFATLAVLGGAAAALQAAANSGLASRIGLGAALLVNTTVVLIGTIAFYLTSSTPRTDFFPTGTPTSLYIGGLCGFVIIAALAFVFPKLGAASAITLMVLGQGAAALLIDHFGWMGMPQTPVSLARIAGIGLTAAGLALMRA